jgi:glycosyltransferase involved in cell wall biosynthesis
MSKTPTVAVGMAHYNDPHGAMFSIQHLRLSTEPVSEYILVDGTRDLPQVTNALRDFGSKTGVTVVDGSHLQGTSQTRNAVFENATADIVICMDCHVLLAPGAIKLVRKYFENPENRKNILSGPMLMDSLRPHSAATHMNSEWRDGMWGTWGTAWLSPEETPMMVVEDTNTGNCLLCPLSGSLDYRGDVLDDVPYDGHEAILLARGFAPWTELSPPGATLEIPGQGLGCFAVWRESWPGFHREASGFGGEELCIHETYRQLGGQAVCLNGFRWWHRFFRESTTKMYPATNWQKVRNYVLWHNQLGLYLSPLQKEFVPSHMSQTEWDRLVADPEGYSGPEKVAVKSRALPMPTPLPTTIDALVSWTAAVPRDLNQHVPYLYELAKQCSRVVEFSGRRESTIALLGCQGSILSYNEESSDPLIVYAHELNEQSATDHARVFTSRGASMARAGTIKLGSFVDLLFLDVGGGEIRTLQVLEKHHTKVHKWIVIHDTAGSSLCSDWCAAHPEWFREQHTDDQHGLTTLRRVQSEPSEETPSE